MPELVPVDYDPFGGGPDPAQRMRQLEQPGRDAIAPISLIGEPTGAKNAADFAAQLGLGIAGGVAGGAALRYGLPAIGNAMRSVPGVLADESGGLPLDRITQLAGDRLAGEAGMKAAGDPARSFSEIQAADAAAPRGYEILKSGEPVGNVRLSFPSPDTGFIDAISAGKIGETSPLGPRAVRDVAQQLFEANPGVNELQGWHVSGARRAAEGVR